MQAVLTKPALDSDAKKVVAVLAALPAGALAAKVAWDRLSDRPDPRRFRLREGESVPDGVVRLAGGQLDLSIERLEGRTDEDLGTAVHEARKSFKRLRAIARLARDELGDDVYRRENTAFRDAGRRLAGARDSQVLLETLDALSERYPRQAPWARFDGFRRTLEEQHAAAQRRLEAGVDVAAVVTELRRARVRVPAWPLDGEALDALAPGFKRIYRRGRSEYRSARREPSDENLHELRKRVKDLWYAARIVRPAKPSRMKRLARDAHELSDLIGEEHDLAILEERVLDWSDQSADERAIGELTSLIERRRDELRHGAMSLGSKLFRKKPRKVARPLANSHIAS